MNALHMMLFGLAGVFFVLWALNPKRPRIALMYLKYTVLTLVASVVLTPFFWLLSSAIKDADILMKYTFLPPLKEWSLETINFGNFLNLFQGEASVQGTVYFWQFILNSLFIATAATVIQMFFCSLGGFAISKYEFKGRRLLIIYMLGSMTMPPMLLLAPIYKLLCGIGWVDTYLALLIPGAANVLGMFLFRQAMLSVPDSLLDAARIDGCGEFRIYMNVVMPLVRPMTAAYCLIAFLAQWNNFLAPQIFIHTKYKLTLPVILSQYVDFYKEDYGVFLAGTLLAIIPPAILFFVLQKEFISGLTSGAVKG